MIQEYLTTGYLALCLVMGWTTQAFANDAGVGKTEYIDIQSPGAFEYFAGHNEIISTEDIRPTSDKTDRIGGAAKDCSFGDVLCFDGLLRFAVDRGAVNVGRPYRSGDFEYTPTCLYSSGEGLCGLVVIKYQGMSEGVKYESGYFIYQANFGIRSFSFTDPKNGRVTSTFTYKSGPPLLGS
jgi:hypothetical protein